MLAIFLLSDGEIFTDRDATDGDLFAWVCGNEKWIFVRTWMTLNVSAGPKTALALWRETTAFIRCAVEWRMHHLTKGPNNKDDEKTPKDNVSPAAAAARRSAAKK